MAHLTNFSFEFFYKIFTEDASKPLLYHGAKKSKMTKNSNQGGPALINAFVKRRVVNARYLLSVVLDGERCGRLASHGLSANLMIARQENVQGSRSHFPILVKLFALWWQLLVQASDITVWSQIAKACAHCRCPDCGFVCFAATL